MSAEQPARYGRRDTVRRLRLRETQTVSIRRKSPTDAVLTALIERCRADSLTYESVGMTKLASTPRGYHRDQWSRSLGQHDDVFTRACNALRQWRVHKGAGLAVVADGPLAVGTMVAMSAPLPVGYIDAVCRVVDIEDEPDRFGFRYGTLSVHPEQGEESFIVTRSPDDGVVFHIEAVSRSHQLRAKVGGPFARRLQRAATRRYLDAMVSAVTD